MPIKIKDVGDIWHCPRSISADVCGWFGDYSRLELGILPSAGAWGDQTARYCQAMHVLKTAIDMKSEEEMENLKRKKARVD